MYVKFTFFSEFLFSFSSTTYHGGNVINQLIDKKIKLLEEKLKVIEKSVEFLSSSYDDLVKKVKNLGTSVSCQS